MHIHTIVTGELQTNCYIATDTATQKCLVIDPGDGADVICDYILTQGLTPTAVVATHGHFDHILAAFEVQTAFDIPFIIHKDDEFLLSRMRSSAEHWLKRTVVALPPKPDILLGSDTIAPGDTPTDTITFGSSNLTVLHTPGHSPGGIAIYDTKERIVFTGDTMFKNGVGRTDYAYASQENLEKSLLKVKKTCAGFKAYPGHEEGFMVQG